MCIPLVGYAFAKTDHLLKNFDFASERHFFDASHSSRLVGQAIDELITLLGQHRERMRYPRPLVTTSSFQQTALSSFLLALFSPIDANTPPGRRGISFVP